MSNMRSENIPKVKSIINIVPKASTLENIALSGSLLACKPIGALSILPWVTVTVTVQVVHFIIRAGTLELETSLIVVPSHKALEKIVVRAFDIESIWAVDDFKANELPVVGLLDMEDATISCGNASTDRSWGVGKVVAINDGDLGLVSA